METGARGRWFAAAAAVVAGSLAVWACGPAPTSSIPPSVVAPTPAWSQLESPALADALGQAIDPAAIVADLRHLEELARAHAGSRDAGGEAESESATFAEAALRDAGFEVVLQPVSVPFFRQDAPSTLEIVGDDAGSGAFADLRDFKAMLLSPSGDVAAPIVALDFDPAAQPGVRNGRGCPQADWADVPTGAVVLVQPGPCFRRDVVVKAQQAGAVAIVTSYAEWSRGAVLRPTLLTPSDIRIPALGVPHEVGIALADAATRGLEVHVATHTTVEMRTSFNVIGETSGGDPDHVLMLGGHLDSAVDGPGINDNGSGTMTILEIARRLASLEGGPATGGEGTWKVRVALWTGEEIGLLGSGAYVQDGETDVGSIEAYLNFDMLGSSNGVRFIYDGAATSRAEASGALTTLFASAFDRAGLAWATIAVGGAGDHASFDQVAVPTGGLFSGANERKTADEAAQFGGAAGAPNDACYHLPCDTVDNLNEELLEEMARGAAWVVGALASGEVDLPES